MNGCAAKWMDVADDNNTIIQAGAHAAQQSGYTKDKVEAHAFAVWWYHQLPMVRLQEAWPAWCSARNWIHPEDRT